MPALEPVLPTRVIDALSGALADFTPQSVTDALGPVGDSALTRGDLDGVARCVRPGALTGDDRIAALTWLFLLGRPLPHQTVSNVLAPLSVKDAITSGLIEQSGSGLRATFEIRPYAHSGWLVCSDFGSDVRPGPLAADHVLGIGGASATLANATIRDPVRRALDLGTGSGVQALHLAEHANQVTATDISARALRLAATTAALSGQDWQLRVGSLLEPVAGERFDLVVANPPFVVSPGLAAGSGGFDYRDSGLPGDEICRRLISGIPAILTEQGVGQLLANWVIPPNGDWGGRIESWLRAPAVPTVDAWVWQREVLGAQEYVSMWLRDAGHLPGTADYTRRYDQWLDWMQSNHVAAVGMGLVTLWRGEGTGRIVCEDLRQAHDEPIGDQLSAWRVRQQWLARHPELWAERLQVGSDVVVDSIAQPRQGWQQVSARLRQSSGLRWDLEADIAIQALVGAADGTVPVGVLIELIDRSFGHELMAEAASIHEVLADLVARGFLLPTDSGTSSGEPTKRSGT